MSFQVLVTVVLVNQRIDRKEKCRFFLDAVEAKQWLYTLYVALQGYQVLLT